MRLHGFSPEQKRQRQHEQRREWERKNRKRKSNKRPIKLFAVKPERQCVICLYRVGFTEPTIAKILRITKTNVGVIVHRAGVSRVPSRFTRNMVNRVPLEEIALRLVTQQYRREMPTLKLFDESRHWWNHPARIAWSGKVISRKLAKAKLIRELAKFKCHFCGCDASAIPQKRRRAGLKFCSVKCQKRARAAAEKLRLQSDPQFWQRKKDARKRCYYRTRKERPEVYKAEVRRKLENPQFRIAKNHRARIYHLVRKGLMSKTQTSLKYFGCTPAHLKQHLESKFKPGMTWGNYGKVWHVDHKHPLSKLDLMNPDECARAFNWTNLTPLFAQENLRKSNKIIDA